MSVAGHLGIAKEEGLWRDLAGKRGVMRVRRVSVRSNNNNTPDRTILYVCVDGGTAGWMRVVGLC